MSLPKGWVPFLSMTRTSVSTEEESAPVQVTTFLPLNSQLEGNLFFGKLKIYPTRLCQRVERLAWRRSKNTIVVILIYLME